MYVIHHPVDRQPVPRRLASQDFGEAVLERGSPVPVPTMMTCLPQKLVASTISLPYVVVAVVTYY